VRSLHRSCRELDAKRFAAFRAQGVGWRAIAKQLAIQGQFYEWLQEPDERIDGRAWDCIRQRWQLCPVLCLGELAYYLFLPSADRLGQIHVQRVNLLGGGISQDERRVIGS
jgi:hypothetical protein